MADLKQILGEEIRRLAKKEVKSLMVPLQESLGMLKKQLADQRRRIAELEKQSVPKQTKAVTSNAGVIVTAAEGQRRLRLNSAGIVRIRTKLGISQTEFAALLGVSANTVSLWEQDKNAPRQTCKARICALRGIGKRELKRRLTEALLTEAADGDSTQE